MFKSHVVPLREKSGAAPENRQPFSQVDLDLAAMQQWLGNFVTMKCTTAFKDAHRDLLQNSAQKGQAESSPKKDQILADYFKCRQFMVSCLRKYL
jgi:hypothetical protein